MGARGEREATEWRDDELTLNPNNVPRLNLSLDRLRKEEVRLTVRKPVRLVERHLSRMICAKV